MSLVIGRGGILKNLRMEDLLTVLRQLGTLPNSVMCGDLEGAYKLVECIDLCVMVFYAGLHTKFAVKCQTTNQILFHGLCLCSVSVM